VLRLANSAASGLLGAPVASLVGRSGAELGLGELVRAEPGTRMVASIAGRPGRWQVAHGSFRWAGMAQHMLVVTDLRPALREEERAAWLRLLRVMGHEVKNSLAPIRSLAGTVRTIAGRELPDGPRRDEGARGHRGARRLA
jgi:nitrogen fixation/metabolism regulation signal transduction histidine kinase